MTVELAEGWAQANPTGYGGYTSRHHYFIWERSLCGVWITFVAPLIEDTFTYNDECHDCRRILDRMNMQKETSG